jgi:cytidylate kinase
MAVITISRQFGAGGITLGEKLSKRLGYRCVHEGMIRQVAKKVKASSQQVRAFEKAGGTKLMKFLDKMVSRDFIDRLLSDKYGYVGEKDYIDVVKALIHEVYEQGDALIIGRGGQYILRGLDNTWHILLIADMAHRISFMMDNYNLSESEAQKAIKRADQIRNSFLSVFSEKGSHDDPLAYDLVINMTRVSMDKAEELIVALTTQ